MREPANGDTCLCHPTVSDFRFGAPIASRNASISGLQDPASLAPIQVVAIVGEPQGSQAFETHRRAVGGISLESPVHQFGPEQLVRCRIKPQRRNRRSISEPAEGAHESLFVAVAAYPAAVLPHSSPASGETDDTDQARRRIRGKRAGRKPSAGLAGNDHLRAIDIRTGRKRLDDRRIVDAAIAGAERERQSGGVLAAIAFLKRTRRRGESATGDDDGLVAAPGEILRKRQITAEANFSSRLFASERNAVRNYGERERSGTGRRDRQCFEIVLPVTDPDRHATLGDCERRGRDGRNLRPRRRREDEIPFGPRRLGRPAGCDAEQDGDKKDSCINPLAHLSSDPCARISATGSGN